MTTTGSRRGPGVLQRLESGPLICAEGYLFELERRGYLQAGAFVPEVVLEHPEQVTALHEQFVHAGSDVVLAFTYYAHREKLRTIGEALLALEAIRAAGLPAVITLVVDRADEMRDGGSLPEACRRLAGSGADVVGLNCVRGPATMLPLLDQVVGAVDVPVAALPVTYRTTPEQPTLQALRDPMRADLLSGDMPFPTALDPFTSNRYEIAEFTAAAAAAGVRYLGLCCGAAPHHVRAMAETLGRTPPASRYSEDMSKHVFFGR
jgi:betaine-homocysteine S-methyltransferase